MVISTSSMRRKNEKPEITENDKFPIWLEPARAEKHLWSGTQLNQCISPWMWGELHDSKFIEARRRSKKTAISGGQHILMSSTGTFFVTHLYTNYIYIYIQCHIYFLFIYFGLIVFKIMFLYIEIEPGWLRNRLEYF